MEPVRLDPAALQGPAAATSAADLLRLLKPGETVSARVLGAVGAGPEGTLYALAFRGQTLVAESAADLAPDAVVRLLVAQAGPDGTPLLRLLAATVANPGNPAVPTQGAAQLLATPQRLAALGLPQADALAAQVLDAFAEAEAPLAPARLQTALAAARQAPAAQAPRLMRAHAELARAGLPATPALVALAERAVSELLPNSGATLRSAQRALATPQVPADGAEAMEPEDEPAPLPRAVPGRAPAAAPAGMATRAPASTATPQPASAIPSSPLRQQSSSPAASPPAPVLPRAPAGAPPVAAVAPRLPVAPHAPATPVVASDGTPAEQPREAVPSGQPSVRPSPARPSAAPLPAPAPAEPARASASPSSLPAATSAAVPASIAGAPPSTAEARPSPAQVPGPLPATPAPAVVEARTPVAAPPAAQGDPSDRAVPAAPLRPSVAAAPDLRAALETLRTLELPDAERGGLPAVLAALRLAGVRAIPAGAVVANASTAVPEQQEGAEAGALHRQIGRAGAALAALPPPPMAQAPVLAAATSPPPPPPEPAALPAALVQAAREQLADQVFRPRELADYDRVVPLPLQAQGQPTPARLAVATRTAAGGQKAAFLRVDAELSELGPVSMRLSGVEGGPLAVTLIAEGAGAQHLAAALPALAADLRALNIDAAIRVVAAGEAAS